MYPPQGMATPLYQQQMYNPPGGGGFGQPQQGVAGFGYQPISQPAQNPSHSGQSLNYRQHNWTGYQLPVYRLNPQFIETYAPGIFQYFDKDKSGALDMAEIPVMINHLFKYLNMAAPTLYDVMFLMFQFDQNGDGLMDFNEFKTMLYYLSGRR